MRRLRSWRWLWHRLRTLVDRKYRQQYERGIDETMRWLLEHPEEPIEWR